MIRKTNKTSKIYRIKKTDKTNDIKTSYIKEEKNKNNKFKKKLLLIFILIVIVLTIISNIIIKGDLSNFFKKSLKVYFNANYQNDSIKILKIASWNIQIFGKKKSSDYFRLYHYISIIKDYDIIIIQELRDSTQISINRLCYFLNNYNCYNSSRSGKSKSKEQYIVIVKKGINITKWEDYNLDKKRKNLWERPPIMFTINYSKNLLTFFSIHTKPSNTKNEINNLIDLVKFFKKATKFNENKHTINKPKYIKNKLKIVILGDLNADCSYYKWKKISSFYSYIDEDTTTSKSFCSYDKILLNNNLNKYVINYGVRNVPSFLSDHKLIWIILDLS